MLALGLIVVVTFLADTSVIGALSGTTALLLLVVFTIVNVACLVLRRDPTADDGFIGARPGCRSIGRGSPACSCVGPWARDSEDWIQYKIAGGLLALGIVLWALTWLTNRGVRAQEDRLPRHRAPRGPSGSGGRLALVRRIGRTARAAVLLAG